MPPADDATHDVTRALRAARDGDPVALSAAFQLVYDQVRAIARARVARFGAGATLDATAVVHEAYLKLARHGEVDWADRGHFIAVASRAMRQILLDQARRHLSLKRGAGANRVPLTDADAAVDAQAEDVVALDAALARLAARDAQLGRVVELRFFVGLSVEEAAAALGVSEATVKRAWRRARDDVPPPDATAGLAGRRLGPFTVTGRLGEGGMGVVLAARQAHPARDVALKVLRGGVFAHEHQLRLFRREAQSLGRLAHPGIAAIYDAGRTDDGLHWFAMERVAGAPLDAWARRRPEPTARDEVAARLAVFLQVCDAISHAHQRGVIHLDLKPSNVLVLDGDGGAPAVKVLDFGIARFLGGDGEASTLGGAGGALAGTLAYMSPEQAGGDARDLDVRSDLYALGVLLYELLTGRLPVDVRDASLTEAVRRIREQEPPRPAGSRALRGDLGTVVAKALAKDPRERYQSVAAFAEDLRRYLENRPIVGRPPSTMYHLRKIVVRHRLVIGFAAALVLALVAAVGGTTSGLLRARRAEAAARQEAAVAERTAAFLESVFRVNDPGESRGSAVTARELLDRAVADVDAQLAGQPRVRGRLLAAMGNAYRQLGLFHQARPLLEEAVRLETATLGAGDLRLARDHFVLAGLLRRLGDFPAAREHYEQALAIREGVLAADHADVAASLAGLANLDVDEGRFDAACERYARVLAVTRRTLGAEDERYLSHLANYALARWGRGDADSALAALQEVVDTQRRVLPPDDLDRAWSLAALAAFHTERGGIAEARALAEEALAVQERALGPDHTDVAETIDVLANLHRRSGDHARAHALHARGAAIWAAAVGAEHPRYAMTLDHLARDLASLGRHEEAIAVSRRAQAIFARTLAPDHPAVAQNLVILAELHRAAGRPREARPFLEQALAARTAAFGERSREVLDVIEELARAAGAQGRWQEAAHHWERASALAAAVADSATGAKFAEELAQARRRAATLTITAAASGRSP